MTLDRAALWHTRGTRTRLFRWVWGQPRQINGGDYYKLGFIIYINIDHLEADLINLLNYKGAFEIHGELFNGAIISFCKEMTK